MKQLSLSGIKPTKPDWYWYKGGHPYISIEYSGVWWVISYGNEPMGPFTKQQATDKAKRLAISSV